MQDNVEVLEIDIKRLALALWERIWVILIVGALVAGIALGYAWLFITPTYAASAQLYVNNTYGENVPGFSTSQLAAAQSLANTYMVIMESRTVLNKVQENIDMDYSVGQLKSMISAEAVNETEVFQINVISTDPKHAEQIANVMAEILPDQIAAVVPGSSVRVIDYAVENPNPVGPNYSKYAIVGALVGCLFSACVVIVLNLMDTSINSEEYLTNTYKDIPLLAVIPNGEGSKNGAYYKTYAESSAKRTPEQKGGQKG